MPVPSAVRVSRPGIRTAVLLVAAVLGGAVDSAPADSAGASSVRTPLASAAVGLLDELAERRVTLDYTQQPLLRITNELEVVHGIPISVDWDGLDALGVDERTEVSIRADEESALDVLARLAFLTGDDFDRAVIESFGGRILLTTAEMTARLQVAASYDVRDLLSAESRRATPDAVDSSAPAAGLEARDPDRPRAGDEASAPADEGAAAGAGLDIDLTDRRTLGPAEQLMRRLVEHSDPEAWFNLGGDRARVTEQDGILTVTASARIHRVVRDLLSDLRALTPRGLGLDVSVISAPAGAYDALARRYDPATSAFARRLISSNGATVLWAARTAVTMGGRLTMSERIGDVPTTLAVAPRWDAERGVLVVAIEISRGESAPAKTSTEVSVALRGGAIILDLPGGGDGAMLVIRPRGR